MQVRIQRVLCVVDSLDGSRLALAHANAVARSFHAGLTILRVPSSVAPDTVHAPGVASARAAAPLVKEVALEELREFVSQNVAGRPVTSVVTSGSAVSDIIELARDGEADLIVVGRDGRAGFGQQLLGSLAERVLRKASCPVLTVPQRLEGGGQANESFRRLLCAIDFSEASLTGLDYALALARAFAASVILLHAVEDLADSPVAPWSFGMPELRTMLQDEASQRLARLIPADAREWCRVESMAGDLEAHHEIMRVARDAWTDLIVMGVHGRSCLGARLLGSTTLRVLEQAGCPVLTVRPASEAEGR